MASAKSSTLNTFLLGFSLLLIPFDFIAYNIFIYPLELSLNIPFFKLPWVLNGLLISFLFFSGLFFQATSYKRAKPLLIWGLLIYALSALFVLGRIHFTLLIFARLFQGLSFAMILPASLTLLKVSKPSKSYYTWGAILVFGLFVSPWITSWILKNFPIHWLFYFLGFYALALALLDGIFLEFVKSAGRKLDPKGFLLIGSSMAILILSLSIGLYWGWGLSSLFFFFSFLLFNLAFFVEKSESNPLFEMELFKSRSFLTCFIPLLFLQFILWPLLFFVPIYLQYLLGVPLFSMGLWLLTFTGAVVVGFIVSSYTYRKGWIRFSIGISLSLLTLSLFLLSFVTETGHRSYLLSILALLGLGWGFLFLNIYSGGVGFFPKKNLIRGFAFYEIFPFLFGSLGLCIGFNVFVKKFTSFFYNALSDADILFSQSINTHFFEILNRPDLYSDAIRGAFTQAFLEGFHSLTTLLSWIGFTCLIFSLIYIPSKTREVLSEGSND